MKVLVTGGAGYMGSHFVKALRDSKLSNTKEILVVDNLENGYKENLIFGHFFKCDLKDKNMLEATINSFKPDLVVHFASYLSVPESMQYPLKYYENNVIGSLNLINSCISNNVKKFIFSSTAATYGLPISEKVTEDSIQNPINPYGKSKLMVENILKDTKMQLNDFNYIILRYFNVAGNDPLFEVGNYQKNPLNLIPIILKNIKSGDNLVNIFGNDYSTLDGTCIRDYIHVSDLVNAHLEVIPILESNKSDIFNVGYGKGYSVLDVIDSVERVSGIKLKRNFCSKRLGDPAYVVSCGEKIKANTLWKPKYDNLDFIVKTTYDWMNRNG